MGRLTGRRIKSQKSHDICLVTARPSSWDAIRGEALSARDRATLKDIGIDADNADFDAIQREYDGEVDERGDVLKTHAGSVIVAVGIDARDKLGDAADFWMPHPEAIRNGRRKEAARKVKAIKKSLTNRDTNVIIRSERVVKAAAEQRLTYGVVLEPDTTDAQGDRETAAEIEKAAHDYLVNSRTVGIHHQTKSPGSRVVESYIALSDMQIGDEIVKKGSWVMVTQHDPDVWELVKNGEFQGYSIGGTGNRNPD